MAEMFEVLHYKLEGRGFDFRFTDLILPPSKTNDCQAAAAAQA